MCAAIKEKEARGPVAGHNRFPETPAFAGFNAPTRIEAAVTGLTVIEGAIPDGLDGAFYRMQPDPAWPPLLGDDISLNGDGLVTSFHFRCGEADYRSRYVRTEKYIAEAEARRALFGAYRNPFTDDPSVAGLSRGTANTSALYHAGKLLVLKEDSLPIEIDPDTLETIGTCDYGGAISSLTLSAHPKVDPENGNLYTYGYSARGEATTDIAYYVISPQGEVLHESWFHAPYGCMIHDFGITENHALFPITPLCSDPDRLRDKGSHFAWDRTRPSYLGVIARDESGASPVWHKGPTCHATHTMNGWEEAGVVHLETPTGSDRVFPFFPATDNQPWDAAGAAPLLSRWSVQVSEPESPVVQTPLTTIHGDFPRIDERFVGRRATRGWIVGLDPVYSSSGRTGVMGMNAIVELDLGNNSHRSFFVGEGCLPQEPQFIPRDTTAREGDGWLLMVRHRPREMASELLILDTRDISAGPVAVIAMPFRLRRGLHGTWVSRASRT